MGTKSQRSRAPYGTIPRSLWTDPTFRQIPAESRLIFLYLLTGPHSHMCGLSHLSLATIADDLRMELETIRTAIEDPLAKLVDYDEQTREMFVIDSGRIQVALELKDGDTRRKTIERHLESIHSERLIERFFEAYGTAWNMGDHTPTNAPTDGASDGASVTPYDASSSKKEQQPKQHQEQQLLQEQAAPETAAGPSTGERQRHYAEDSDRNQARSAAKLIATPRSVGRWTAWIAGSFEERYRLVMGLRYLVDMGDTDWPRGELFATPDVFDKCSGLRGQAESAYWNLQNEDSPRTASTPERVQVVR